MMRWIKQVFRPGRLDAEMRAEMEFHRQARAADLVARHGLSEQEAARRARLEFGSMDTYREEGRAALGLRLADELRGDLRYAARGIRRDPGFAAAAACILALAIGANAAFFTLYSNYALRPLPIRGAERHVELEGRDRTGGQTYGWSPDEMSQLRQAGDREMEGVYSTSGLLQVLLLAPVERQIMVQAVSSNYFPLLGGQAASGRVFSEAEERQPVAVLSDAGWRRLLPGVGDPTGQQVRIRATWFTIAGVMPGNFTGTEAAVPDLWVGPGMREALRDGIGLRQNAAGLLRPGATPAAAAASLTAAAVGFVRPSEQAVAKVGLRARSTYFSTDSGETRVAASLVFATFLLVLAIACANLANLFLAKTAARGHEISMRVSLGASRGRIVRQLLTESSLVAMLGAAAGLALGWLFVVRAHAWLSSFATGAGAVVLPLMVDWRAFVFSGVLGLLSGAAFGLFPALEATEYKKRRRPRRLRGLLLGSQVAASFVLLVLAAVLVRNIQRLAMVNAGYDVDRVFDLQLEPPVAQVLDRLRAHPAVAGAAAVARVPLYGRMNRAQAETEGVAAPVAFNYVDEHYFETVGLALEAGRGFYRPEAENGARVAVVSNGAVRRLWSGAQPLGKTLTIEGIPYEVIGVVPDVINGWLFEGAELSMVYLPGAAGGRYAAASVLRLRDATPSAVEAVKQVCRSSAGSTGCDPRSLREVAEMQRFPFRAAAAIAGLLGGVALLLTAAGLYSVVSYSVEQRRREIGLMMALGARPRHVVRGILAEAARCFVSGVVVGLPVCLALSRAAASSVFQVRTFDTGAYALVPVLLAAAATAACLVPVRRALRLEPMVALRQD